jgi:RimJ/RimL family protein N-acetyltransferase
MAVLETARFRLAKPNANDDEDIAALRSEPAFTKYLGFIPPTCSVEEARERREKRESLGAFVMDFTIRLKNPAEGQNSFVGVCGFFLIDPVQETAEAGIAVKTDYHRSGVASETFLGLLDFFFNPRAEGGLGGYRVSFMTDVANTPMRGWFRNALGLEKPEYIQRQAWKGKNNDRVDAAGYAVLKPEWFGGMRERLAKKVETGSTKSETKGEDEGIAKDEGESEERAVKGEGEYEEGVAKGKGESEEGAVKGEGKSEEGLAKGEGESEDGVAKGEGKSEGEIIKVKDVETPKEESAPKPEAHKSYSEVLSSS